MEQNNGLGRAPSGQALAVSVEPVCAVSPLTGFDPSRWWRELRNPSLKCERLGHAMEDREQFVFIYPATSIMRSVATEGVEITPTCKRCGHTEPMRFEVERHLTGLTMSADDWRRLRRDGRLAR